MPVRGFDTPYTTVDKAWAIKRAGFSFVIRYISPDSNTFVNKRITLQELSGLKTAGLAVGFIWEISDDPSTLNTDSGTAHAQEAIAVMVGLGLKSGDCSIGFAVDFDATQSQLDENVTGYFKAIKAVCDAAGWEIEVYGSGQVCEHLSNLKIVEQSWLAQAMGWSMSKTYTDYDLIQGESTTAVGLPVDIDTLQDNESLADAGFYLA